MMLLTITREVASEACCVRVAASRHSPPLVVIAGVGHWLLAPVGPLMTTTERRTLRWLRIQVASHSDGLAIGQMGWPSGGFASVRLGESPPGAAHPEMASRCERPCSASGQHRKACAPGPTDAECGGPRIMACPASASA